MVRPAPVRDARFDLSKWDEPKRASSRKTETSGKKKRAKREVTPEEEPSEVEEQLESDADDGSASEDGDASANDEAREDDAMTDDDDAPEDAYDDSGSDQGAASDQEQDMAGASDDDAHDLHDSEHARQRVLTPESLKEYANKQQKRGIVYVSRIPPGMTPAKVRHIFSQFGEVGRIYLQPKDKEPKGAQKRKRTTANFSEGWVEYLSKRVAKTAAEMMNAQPIGSLGASAHSSRRSQTGSRVANRWKDDIWTMKYLKGFRWPMLIEQMSHERAAHAARLRMELAQSAHEQRDYLRKVERSRIQREKEAKRAKRGLPQEPASSTFEFQQRAPVYRDVRDQRAAQRTPSAAADPQMDRVLDQIL
ncbi:RNA-binding ATPase activator esf2 [Malassezia furfur]|uniref:18S rRNA factor 2 n=1 Tax=Malassezia furfur TaxID=55194 RepID=A0ABY8ET33_MALFU|nr:ESF2 [Malassezia furfur]WFD47880.1 RNA-binding ATPase activator esf2 [Malassezia furfur]